MAIRSLARFTASRTIYVITSAENFPFFQELVSAQPSLELLNEDEVIAGVTLQEIRGYLTRRIGSGARAGWYFQQMLKMALCGRGEVAPHYLIWDSDTIALRPLIFFDDSGRSLVNPKTERVASYFDWMRKALKLERQVRFSFISEHLMVAKESMRELIAAFSGVPVDSGTWVWRLLDLIDDRHLGRSGFSEYETYGNFVASRHPDSFTCRRLKSTRHATVLFGTAPRREDVHYLMLAGHSFASFETYAPQSRVRIALNRAVAGRLFSLSTWIARHGRGRGSEQLAAAGELCP